MTNNNKQDRVLNRLGARELTQEETGRVTGRNNRFITVATATQTGVLAHPDHDFDE